MPKPRLLMIALPRMMPAADTRTPSERLLLMLLPSMKQPSPQAMPVSLKAMVFESWPSSRQTHQFRCWTICACSQSSKNRRGILSHCL